MTLRIFSGKLKYRTIEAPKTRLTRPASARLRQVIFDSIAPYLENAHVLDLFAGSGLLAIEAISLGAKSAILIEKGAIAYKTIHKNINKLELKQQMLLKKACAMHYLQKTHELFDIIFLDPPYTFDTSEYKNLLTIIKERNLLKKNGIIVLEIQSNIYSILDSTASNYYSILKEKKLGATILNVLTQR